MRNARDQWSRSPGRGGWFGDLILKDKERSQPRAGRLDLLLQDPETDRRYEVELQLGRTDGSHIVRSNATERVESSGSAGPSAVWEASL